MKNDSTINYLYDKGADIFYITKGKPRNNDISNEVDDGVIARFDPKTKEVKGLTILSFSKRTKKNSQTLNLPFKIAFAV